MCEQELLHPVAGAVTLERRQLLRLSLTALAGFCLQGTTGALSAQLLPAAAPASASLDWDRLLEQARTAATTAVAAASRPEAEDLYLQALASLFGRLTQDPGEAPGQRPTARVGEVDFELLHRREPVLALRFRMSPGAVLPFHNHRHQNGVMKLLAGDIELRSFDPIDPQRAAGATVFAVRETARQQLATGNIAILSRRRNNIHGLTAGPGGALVLDFFTHYRADASSQRLEISDTPIDPVTQRYRARVAGRF